MANIDLEKLTLLYEGKAKQVYQTDDKETYIAALQAELNK